MEIITHQLVKQILRIEDYDPEKDYPSLFDKAQTYYEKLAVIKKYYLDNERHIINLATNNLMKSFNIYAFDWIRFFTPIEMDAWQCIRCAGIILYPQYPALNYMLDFANPYLKIALELDGKDYHVVSRDLKRDQRLYDKEGWKVFRVTGSEANKIMSMPNTCPDIYDDEGYHEICDFMYTTVDGVIEALKEIYFYPRKDIEDSRIRQYNELCIRTLQAHRLADFKIL